MPRVCVTPSWDLEAVEGKGLFASSTLSHPRLSHLAEIQKIRNINSNIIYSFIHSLVWLLESKSFHITQDGLKVTILLPQPLAARILSMHHCVHLRTWVVLPPTVTVCMLFIGQGPIKTQRCFSVACWGSVREVTHSISEQG